MSICPSCGSSFDCKKSMCIHHKLSHGGSLVTELSSCNSCDTEFEYYPSDKEGKFCSDCVKDTPWEWKKSFSGEDHPQWNSKSVNCSNCGSEIVRKQSSINSSGVHYCSDKCMSEHRSESWTGENHPNWKGGETSSYGRGWAKIRRKVRERDDYKCRYCGKEKDESYNIEVHHIEPVREFDNIEDAHFLSNLICLCRKCHVNADHGNISRAELNQKI